MELSFFPRRGYFGYDGHMLQRPTSAGPKGGRSETFL